MAQSPDHFGVLAILAGVALIEYLFPPFPGDTISLLGAVMVSAHGWSFALVFAALMIGSLAGSMGAFYLGDLLLKRRKKRHAVPQHDALARIVASFEAHGPLYLVLNRFLPGIRSLFFVAAGMAGLRARTVFILSAISAAAWNLMLMAVGNAVGANLDKLEEILRNYSIVAWIVAAIIVALIAWRSLRRS